MPYVQTLDKIKIDSMEVFRRQVQVDTGEVDAEGNPIMTHIEEWTLRVKYLMFNDQAGRKRGERVFPITDTNESAIKGFMKQFVSQIKADMDIQDGEDWADV